MDLLSPIKDHHSERRLFIARVILTSVFAIVLLGLVIARLVQLQVFDYEHFAARSQGNRIRIEAVPPIRGLVFDRQGRILADNLPAYPHCYFIRTTVRSTSSATTRMYCSSRPSTTRSPYLLAR